MSELLVGPLLPFESFDAKDAGDIKILSADRVDIGATAYILPGELHRARSGTTTVVALKVFPVALSAVQQELLKRELRASSYVDHPNILPFLGICQYGLNTVLVSPLMEYGNLLTYLLQHPTTQPQPFILQIAEALAFLHDEAGLVHGDIKCENVLVSPNHEAMLADFGLSTSVDKSATEVTTVTGIRERSTLRFSAPELLLASEDSEGGRPRSKTPATDVWAFGMLVLQAFTKSRPWSRYNDVGATACIVRNQTPARPGTSLNNAYWALCVQCWRIQPAMRPTMNTIAKALSSLRWIEALLRIPGTESSDGVINSLEFIDWEGLLCYEHASDWHFILLYIEPQHRIAHLKRVLNPPPPGPCSPLDGDDGGAYQLDVDREPVKYPLSWFSSVSMVRPLDEDPDDAYDHKWGHAPAI
ncbi:kinase-like protein [Exidia glandulosa HHB12029]|uniref:Kinase-like protein n=1 Tax=Exidia glandulosa HHB12029 TaxID=1314781 RepID=A0A165B8P8_EXIGL|nr:kinase-like protein [Exidia glandulosa HHB12029]